MLGLLCRLEHNGTPKGMAEVGRKRSLWRKKMSMRQTAEGANRESATTEDVVRILGELEPTEMLPIMRLRPTIADIEEASMWLGGDRDVFGPGQPLKGIASQIVTILTADEEQEPPRTG